MRGALLDDKTIGCDAETRIGHFTVMEEARLELTLFCPGASCALQHGGFVPREWLAAKGNYGVLNFEFGGLVLSTRAGCKRRFTRGFRVGLVLIYPGCQRLFTRGFRCVRPKAEDGSACGRSPLVASAEGRSFFGLRPTPEHLAAREKQPSRLRVRRERVKPNVF